MAAKINKAERKAAGCICLTAFGICNTLTHTLRQIAYENPPSGGGCRRGLTPKEAMYVDQLADKFHEQGEILRRLGWRFLGQ